MKFITKIFNKNRPIINVIRLSGVIASGSKFPGSSNLSLEKLDKQLEYHITSFEWVSIQQIAQIIAGQFPGTEIVSAKQKDKIQLDKRNEPDSNILKYWKPEIGIEEGIIKIIKEME